jgi:hypothetical protein
MGTTLGNFDDRLRAELHREFDSQVVDTPSPHRARYARLARPSRSLLPMRTVAFVTAVFAIGVLAGLVYSGRVVAPLGPGRQLGAVPAESSSPSAATTSAPSTPTAKPSPSATPRQTAVPRTPTPPPGTPAAARPSFADDFHADAVGANPPGGWHVDGADWEGVVDDGGHVVRHGSGQGLSHLVAGSPQWADYAVTADVNTDLILDLGFAGVAGRYQDAGDDYECGVSVGGQLQLWVLQGGQRRLLDSTGVSLDLSGRHTVSLDMRGSQLTCSLDGAPLLHASDATFTAGRIALVASSGEGVEFGNVRVSST